MKKLILSAKIRYTQFRLNPRFESEHIPAFTLFGSMGMSLFLMVFLPFLPSDLKYNMHLLAFVCLPVIHFILFGLIVGFLDSIGINIEPLAEKYFDWLYGYFHLDSDKIKILKEKLANQKSELQRLAPETANKVLIDEVKSKKISGKIKNFECPLKTHDIRLDGLVEKMVNKANFLMKRIDPHAQTSAYNFIVQSMTGYLPDLIKLYHTTPIEVLKLKPKNTQSVYDIILDQLSVVHEGLRDLEGEFLKNDHRQLRISEKYLAQVLVTHDHRVIN